MHLSQQKIADTAWCSKEIYVSVDCRVFFEPLVKISTSASAKKDPQCLIEISIM